MSPSKLPLAAAVDHTATHKSFRQVIKIMKSKIISTSYFWDFDLCNVPGCLPPAPCSPQVLTAVSDCGTNSLLAVWNASLGATFYTATVTGPDGFSENCSSSNLTCFVSGLQCASQYNIRVTSHDSLCTSVPSQTVLTTGCVHILLWIFCKSEAFSRLETHHVTRILSPPGPCDPANVTSALQCGSNMATVSWEAAAGAVAYTVIAQDDGSQHYTSCRSGTTSCQLSQLQCGKHYNLAVMAEDATCNSTGNTRTILMTGSKEEAKRTKRK